MMTDKITDQHLRKTAFVYIRQSSMGQVRHHRESTERQYALQDAARSFGWQTHRIKVLDGDLGRSGVSATNRTDFKTLVAEVSLGNAGAVLALEASRLARSNADWHRLIEICGIAGTLIIDEDGCYDPSDFNDGLLLGLKGTMAQAELHFIRSRLQGGKLNKAQKGELRFPLPVGYVFDEANRIVKDPDTQVRSAIELVFTAFEQSLKNVDRLDRNRTNPKESVLSGPAREGLAMLQGLLICGCCGRRLTPRYRGNGGIYPIYECNWRKREGLAKKSCMSIACGNLDRAIELRVWQVVNEEHLNLALEAYDIIQHRQQQISTQWKLRQQRAEYEAQLAQKCYEQVDPSNRLVASTLEQRWNDALIELEDVRNQIVDLQQQQNRITPEQREEVLNLAQNLPRLWNSSGTSPKDKKRILQLLIQDITVERFERRQAILHVRWQGGLCEDVHVELPRPIADQWRHSEALVQRVRELANEFSDEEIAFQLNTEGLKSNKGNSFTRSSIRWIRHRHAIPPVDKKKPEERTVKELAQQFGVSHGVVYYWINRKIITARRLNQGSPLWITIDQQTEKELEKRVQESNRIRPC